VLSINVDNINPMAECTVGMHLKNCVFFPSFDVGTHSWNLSRHFRCTLYTSPCNFTYLSDNNNQLLVPRNSY